MVSSSRLCNLSYIIFQYHRFLPYINWKRIFARSSALEASDRSIAVSIRLKSREWCRSRQVLKYFAPRTCSYDVVDARPAPMCGKNDRRVVP